MHGSSKQRGETGKKDLTDLQEGECTSNRNQDETDRSTELLPTPPNGPGAASRLQSSSAPPTPTLPISQQSYTSATSRSCSSTITTEKHLRTPTVHPHDERLEMPRETPINPQSTPDHSKNKGTSSSQHSLTSATSSKLNSPPILKHSHKKQKQQLWDDREKVQSTKKYGSSNLEANESMASASEPSTMISILNVVVDYYMSEPTPLEPQEFQWKLMMRQQKLKQESKRKEAMEDKGEEVVESLKEEKSPSHFSLSQNDTVVQQDIQVPVLRIFGPIVRGQRIPIAESKPRQSNETETSTKDKAQTSKKTPYLQSACLHIHEAYPYLLARPVAAGPDGSSIFLDEKNDSSKDFDTGRTQIDWDDAGSVSQILEDIHCQLESMLVSSMEQASPLKEDKTHNSLSDISLRFIRKLTIVEGRGFYTYCNGTTAPFIKVEYYNPSHRWRVKILLERGLDLPLEFHPRNDTLKEVTGYSASDGDSSSFKALKFRCYEAHIPYTMQFFKVR